MRLSWTQTGEESLAQIERDLRSFSAQSAQTWVRRIRRAAQTTVDLPRRNRIVPEIGSDEFRELFVGRYRLWYRIATRSRASKCS